jgi:hypothetical protein
MDFNYYYHRQQEAQMRAEDVRHGNARAAHREMADAYGRLIEDGKRQRQEPVGIASHG